MCISHHWQAESSKLSQKLHYHIPFHRIDIDRIGGCKRCRQMLHTKRQQGLEMNWGRNLLMSIGDLTDQSHVNVVCQTALTIQLCDWLICHQVCLEFIVQQAQDNRINRGKNHYCEFYTLHNSESTVDNIPGLSTPRNIILRNFWNAYFSFTRSSDVHLVLTWNQAHESNDQWQLATNNTNNFEIQR